MFCVHLVLFKLMFCVHPVLFKPMFCVHPYFLNGCSKYTLYLLEHSEDIWNHMNEVEKCDVLCTPCTV